MDLKKLAEPFHPSAIKWRVGSTTKDKSKGMALAYADARAFMDRLDEIVGADKWQDEYFDSPSGRVFCKVGIKFGDEWVWKADGAGETQVEGEKGAISDAFKRACVKWGLGRYLYDLKSPWVELEQRGSSYVIAPGAYGQLNALLSAKPSPTTTKTQKKQAPKPEPQTENPADDGKIADIRASIEGATGTVTLGFVADRAVLTGKYTHVNHSFNAIKQYDFPDGVIVEMGTKVSVDGGLKVFDWLMERKQEEA